MVEIVQEIDFFTIFISNCTIKRKMPTFQEAREVLLYAVSANMVSDKEFVFLYDVSTLKNRDFEYYIYSAFNLHEISDNDYMAEFIFQKNGVSRLVKALQLPDEIQFGMHNDFMVSMVEALCVLLKRLAFPCQYSDMMPRFA